MGKSSRSKAASSSRSYINNLNRLGDYSRAPDSNRGAADSGSPTCADYDSSVYSDDQHPFFFPPCSSRASSSRGSLGYMSKRERDNLQDSNIQ